jgi:hypothetical protein
MAAAAPRVTPVTLELGGKDAFVVCGDADLSQVVPIAIKAAFLNCGQNCASGERYVVEASIYDKFCARVAETARTMRQGPALGAGEDGARGPARAGGAGRGGRGAPMSMGEHPPEEEVLTPHPPANPAASNPNLAPTRASPSPQTPPHL